MRLSTLALVLVCSLSSTLPCAASASASIQDPAKGPGGRAKILPPPIPVPPKQPKVQEPEPEKPPEAPKKSFEEEFNFFNNFGEPTYASLLAILARDAVTGDLGVAMVSGLPACGGVLADARAGAGVVVVGARPRTLWRQEAMLLLESGRSAAETVEALSGNPDTRGFSENKSLLAVLDNKGNGKEFIGAAVLGVPNNTYMQTTDNCMMIGCLLAPGSRYDRIVSEKFLETDGLPLPERLLLCLQAAAEAKEDGPLNMQNKAVSAAMLVVREGGGYDGTFDRLVDVRVDYSDDPIRSLRGMYRVWSAAVMIPRLRAMLRQISDVQGEEYKRANRWLTRVRMGYKVGEKK